MNLTKADLQLIRNLLGNHYDRVDQGSALQHEVEGVWTKVNSAIVEGDYANGGTEAALKRTATQAKKRRAAIPKENTDFNNLF